MRDTANRRALAAVGLGLVASHALLVWIVAHLSNEPGTKTFAAILPMVLSLALPTGLALLIAPRLGAVRPTRAALAAMLVVGLAMRVLWLGSEARIEDDFYRYLWDGAVLAHGLDPYRHAPQDILAAAPAGYEVLAREGRELLVRINFPELNSIYPTIAQVVFALAALIAPFKLDALRAVFLAAELATLWLLLRLLVEHGASPLWAALYWCNPLPAFTLIGMAHVDALIPPLVLAAVWAMRHAWPYAAAACLAAGAGVKIWPLLLLPLAFVPLLRQPRRLALASVMVALLLTLALGPVLWSTWSRATSGLGAYAASWDVNNAPYAWASQVLEWIMDEDRAQALLRAALAAAAGIIALAVAWRRDRNGLDPACGALIIAASVFYLSPAQFPWYAAAWFLPLAALLRCWPLLLASATLPICYLIDPFWLAGWGETYGNVVAALHAAPVLAWLAWDWTKSRHGAPRPN